MENKLGFGAGILTLTLCFLAQIPLGIYFIMGVTATTGIPLNLLQVDDVPVFVWGIGNQLWTEMGDMGPYAFGIYFLLPLIAGLLCWYGAFTKATEGKRVFLVASLLLVVPLVLILLEVFVVPFLAFSQVPDSVSFGAGLWAYISAAVLAIVAMVTHSVEEGAI